MRVALLLAAAALSACAPLRSEPLPEVGPPEYARVVSQRPLDIRAGETATDRAAWALLTLDPLIIATAILAVEDEHGRSQLTEYDLALIAGGSATVRSRYVVETGRCVMMRRPTGGGQVVIVTQDEARCGAAQGEARP